MQLIQRNAYGTYKKSNLKSAGKWFTSGLAVIGWLIFLLAWAGKLGIVYRGL